jgi:alkanesulfonate monooxygenase SsuD/methylene tetrahydromethanopterin reductase-like flavin-dependent oxidoreductase (luciferase family)
MLELGIFHNGSTDLPLVKANQGMVTADASLAEMHSSFQRTLVDEVRQGILAERLGYNYLFYTEHHFQPEGGEFSPNPLLTQSAIAAQTKRIRLGQMANILPWWHPIRLAEQAAMLDIISGGRLEFGIGRGHQPREAEVFGRPLGSTIQDQERNRSYYHEAYEIILKAWTQPSFEHHGEFFSIPPSYTRWNHSQTAAYFSRPKAGRKVDDVMRLGAPDMYSSGPPIFASTTTLKEISVFPQPLQKPHPQVWEPVTSERSIRWAARHGLNCFTVPEPTSRLKRNVEIFYVELENCGWPDRLGRGRFKRGWDSGKRRGYAFCRYVHLVLPGQDRRRELERMKLALELLWDNFQQFGFAAALQEPGEPFPDLNAKIPAELLLEKQVALFGTPAEVAEAIMRVKEQCGYEDLLFSIWFELGGFAGSETEAQMQYFAEEVAPLVARACGGQVENPICQAELLPAQ